jgi:hypothetical protein
MDKIERLAESLIKANEAARQAYKGIQDVGSVNYDSPVIKLTRWSDMAVKEVIERSGVNIGDRLNSSFWSGYRFVGINIMGQASLRSAMARAAYESLKNDGYDVMLYEKTD